MSVLKKSIQALLSEGDVSADALEKVQRFAEMAQTWGGKIDLFSTTADKELAEILFVDAIELADRGVVPRGAALIDVGAGGGAPTLPLILMRPDLDALLVEPRAKRCAFLRAAIGSLSLVDRVAVLQTTLTLESVSGVSGPLAGRHFDVALSRATLSPERWLELGRSLAPRVIVMTGSQPAPEQGWLLQRHYRIPSSGAERTLTVYDAPPTRSSRGT